MIKHHKKPTLWLHVGAPKTGTTAFQLALEAAGANLLKEGWLYPLTGRLGPGHHHFARAVNPSRPYNGDVSALFKMLENEALAVGAENVLLSSEDFFLDCDLNALRVHLNWAEVKVVVYLRGAKSWINSYFAQYIKDPYFRFYDAKEDTHDVLTKLARFADPERVLAFADTFGQDSLLIRHYDDPEIRSDLVIDACNAIGLSPSFLKTHASTQVSSRSNLSIKPDELELVRLSNMLTTDEKNRDRLLHELQMLSERRTDNKNNNQEIFDLGLNSKKNQKALSRMSAKADILFKRFGKAESDKGAPESSQKIDQETALIELIMTKKLTLTQQQLITMSGGLNAQHEYFMEQFDGLAHYIQNSIAYSPIPNKHLSYALPKKLWEKLISFFRRNLRKGVVDKNDIIILIGEAANIQSPAGLIGMISIFELGLCEESRLYIEVKSSFKKRSFVQITRYEDFQMLAAGLLKGEPLKNLSSPSKMHLIAQPIFPFQPMALDQPSQDVASVLMRVNAPMAFSIPVKSNQKLRTFVKLFFSKNFKPRAFDEDAKKMYVEKASSPFVNDKWQAKWPYMYQRILYAHCSSRSLPIPNDKNKATDQDAYTHDLIAAWDLSGFHQDFLLNRILPKAIATQLYINKRS